MDFPVVRFCWHCGLARNAVREIRLLSYIPKWNAIEGKKKLMYEYKDKRLCFNCLHPYLYLKNTNA
tara:strand:+ start:1259 stop:1456 length:198 start_codon:yes stop_codon:yes gene_type:complete